MSASTQDKITDVRNAARPNSARVTSARSAAGVTLACDNLVGWPTASKVHLITYSVDSNSEIVDGTQLDCYGIVSGNNLTSFVVVDGNDTGHAIGDYVEMVPTAAWGQDLADALTNEHNRTGTHAAVTATSLTTTGNIESTGGALKADTVSEHTAAAGVTVDGVLIKDSLVQHSGAVQQVVYVSSSAVNTGTVTIPRDDTIPQITEGTEYLTLAISPKSATNILVIDFRGFFSFSASATDMHVALFQDATANALAATATREAGATFPTTIPLRHIMVAGTTASTTFRIRAGSSDVGTTTFNGIGGARLYGGVAASSITITEYKA